MGFLDNFFQKKEAFEEVEFSSLGGFFDGKISALSAETSGKLKPLLDDVSSSLSSLRTMVLDFERLDYPVGTPERLEKIVRTSKPKYAKAMLNELDNLDVKVCEEYAGNKLVYGKLTGFLESVAKIGVTHGRYLEFVFNENITNIRKECKKIADNLEMMASELNASRADDFISAKELYARILDSERKLASLKADSQSATEHAKSLKTEVDKICGKRDELFAGNEMKKHEAIKQDLTDVSNDINRIEAVLNNRLNCLNRTLRKYRKHLIDLGNNRLSAFTGKFLENPMNAFLSYKEDSMELLESLRKDLDAGAIKVDDKQKISARIRDALDFGEFEPKLSALRERKRVLEAEVSSSVILGEAARLEVLLRDVRLDYLKALKDSENFAGMASSLEDSLLDLKKDLVLRLGSLGVRLKLEEGV